jgi:protein O-GlcNAc transferase
MDIMRIHAAICVPIVLSLCIQGVELSAAEENPDFDKGISLRMEQKNRQALDAFTKALAVSPAHATALVHMGATLEDLGKWKDAEQAYRRALEADPDNVSAKRNLEQLEAFRNMNLPVKGPTALEKVLTTKGLQALEQGEFDEALRCFQLLQGFFPDDPRPVLSAAATWEQSGNSSEAEVLYRRMSKAFPNYAPARVNLVILLIKAGQREKAVNEARAALETLPDDERIRFLARMLGAEIRLSDDRGHGDSAQGPTEP